MAGFFYLIIRMEVGHIYYINAKFKHKNKVIELNEIVYKHNINNKYNRKRILFKYKIKNSVILYDIIVLAYLGKSNI